MVEGATRKATGELRLVELFREYDDFVAVNGIDLDVPPGSFFALLGPSGCGKTTTLRMIAGLEEPTSGRIFLGTDDITNTRAHQRRVNTVFQSYALFPHLNIIDNVGFGLRQLKVANWKTKAMEALELVKLADRAKQKPRQLSGGMQQRVALARAIVNEPEILLLDEPLGALDLKLRREMQIELKRIQQEVGITFIHVTHDQEEAMTMADTVAVMRAGRIEQLGEPAALYDKPATAFVANFLGQSNLLPIEVTAVAGDRTTVASHGTSLVVESGAIPTEAPDGLRLGIRPEKLRLVSANDSVWTNKLSGEVTDASFNGVSTTYLVRMPWGQELTVTQPNDGTARATLGEQVTIAWDPHHAFVIGAD
ncbi:ABC transporter ATP-binding protein [Propionicimonas sp.]|uniref:ABC transporter ATP-binding protein n=1 Tax=Propionicimonas sp. TaxID=1955623 RepID=UPI0017ADA151|nr:ABC transporter ATP-binding protein [Propionicimonas sp.]MBU3976433.1 ABC transporter ATP-binding protein [Actinomycetota bacterium]MBA3020273.1 ABC transporter ATP-binding protein [Propionicimonas sp.]MBU3986060.1 ABC transporter ATP-binding protein [Actinomycetota bacterium]MBU4007577.1 ABC transporter ATP-binding protein [Actinomycetota bacterium]MBU4064358.1 ABC transporter ATP-binding protein [Actinomycetota bacterium]